MLVVNGGKHVGMAGDPLTTPSVPAAGAGAACTTQDTTGHSGACLTVAAVVPLAGQHYRHANQP
jgi:hypothetical protein